MINGLHLYSYFLTSGHSKRFTTMSNNHPYIHTFTHRLQSQPCKASASSSEAVRVQCLAQGHLDTRSRRGSNLPVASQPAPPEPHSLLHILYLWSLPLPVLFQSRYVTSYFAYHIDTQQLTALNIMMGSMEFARRPRSVDGWRGVASLH